MNIPMKDYEQTLKCPKCGGLCFGNNLGMWVCETCEYEEPNDFGKVREYIEKYGNSSALEISRVTGVPIRRITEFLRKGRLEIPEESSSYIHCQRCEVELRYGKYCPKCAAEVRKELEDVFDLTEVGVIPKKTQAKMQFLDKKRS